MPRRNLLLGLVGFVALSGCAGQRHAQHLDQITTAVRSLKERVSTLERVTHTPPPSTPTAQPTPGPQAAPIKTKRNIQAALTQAGFYHGPLDGTLGPPTRAAIKQFQRAHNLPADGIVGHHTWEKLVPYLSVATGNEQPGSTSQSK